MARITAPPSIGGGSSLTKAAGSDITTGTDDAKYLTSKALADATTGKFGAAWTSWAPTVANLTTGNGTFACAYFQIGKVVSCRFKFTFGSSSSISGNVSVTLPVSAYNTTQSITALVSLVDDGTTYYQAVGINDSTASSLNLYVTKTDGTYATTVTNVTATVPHTWATGDIIRFLCTYEAA